MEPTLSSETSAFILQTPGKFPKEHRLHSRHCESLQNTKGQFLPGVELSNFQQCQVVVVTLSALKEWNNSSNETTASQVRISSNVGNACYEKATMHSELFL